jgi:phytoene synthase
VGICTGSIADAEVDAPMPGPDLSPAGLSPCAAELRRHDPDRFLTALFAPAERREALFALYAFNLEVARAREMVSEPMLGRIRLQWWREAIEGIYAGTPRRHYVVDPLAAAVARHGLARASFDRLLESREADMEAEGPATLAALTDYAEGSSASLVDLALQILGEGALPAPAREAGRRVGVAWALAGLLRAVPFHARARRLYLPQDLVGAAGLRLEDLFELRQPPALAAVVRQVADTARAELSAARAVQRPPRALLPALLPGTLAGLYLKRLAAAGHDPFDARVQQAPPLRVARLIAAQALGRI